MSGALVLWRDGTSRPAQTSTALARCEVHHRRCAPSACAPFTRQPSCATSVLISVTNIERSAANGRSPPTGGSSVTSSTCARCRAFEPQVALPPRANCRRNVRVAGSNTTSRMSTNGRSFDLDRPDQERRAVGAPAQVRRRQRPRAPVAVLRIEHQHFLGAVLRARPELQQLHAGLDPVADAHRHDGLAPEVRDGEADQLPLLGLVDRDAARLLGDERRAVDMGQLCRSKRRAVDHDGADVGRMHRLDLEPAHLAASAA